MGRTKTRDGGAHGSTVKSHTPILSLSKQITSHPQLLSNVQYKFKSLDCHVGQFGFGFLSPTARQGVKIEKLIEQKSGSICPALLPVNCKKAGKSQLPLWPTVSIGKLKILCQMILKVPCSLKNQRFQTSIETNNQSLESRNEIE